jgi:hypothetical protein
VKKDVGQMGTDYIEESGTASDFRGPRHNGYYAGSFSGVPFPAPRELVHVVRDVQRLMAEDKTSLSRW